MDISQLRIFCKLVECGSFTKVAQDLYVSQSTISYQLRSLEDELEAKLLDRVGKALTLTAAGKIFYKYAKQIINTDIEARQHLQQLKGLLAGELTIGASTLPGEYILPKLIERFKHKYPAIKLTIKIADTAKIIQSIIDRELELGIVGAKLRQPTIKFIEFLSEQLRLIASASHRLSKRSSISLGELKQVPFIIREYGSGTRLNLEKQLKSVGIKLADLNIVAELGSLQAVKQAVLQGLGLSIVSEQAIKEEVASGKISVVPIEGLEIRRTFYIVYEAKRTLSPAANEFLEFIKPKKSSQATSR